MMRLFSLFFLCLLTAASDEVLAGFDSANELHASCSGGNPPDCISYVRGVIDGSDVVGGPMYCWPEKGTLGQARDIVKQWLERNPALRAMPAGAAVIAALREAFPQKRMWRPVQENAAGEYAFVPLARTKTTEDGMWVTACPDGRYNDLNGFVVFWSMLPDNYEQAQKWFDEYFD